jgi:hypothetical protein
MLIVLSPAKSLDFSSPPEGAPLTSPQLTDDTAELATVAKKLRAADLKRLMSISDSLAKLNRERFQAFDPASEEGLQAAFAQDHVRILSGLYGVLRPMDAIQPYRLEMGVRLKTKRGQSLYDFWGPRIAQALNEAAMGHKDKTLVNCASGEYFGSVDRAALKLPLLSCRFLEEKDGEARIISFFAKKARGMLARWVIDNRVDRAADLKGFDAGGYRFVAEMSDHEQLTFARPQPAPAAAKKAARTEV